MSASIVLNNDTLTVSGPLTHNTVEDLLVKAKELLSPKVKTIHFDKVSDCDSASLAFLVCLFNEARQSNINLKISNLPNGLNKLLKITHLDTILPLPTKSQDASSNH